MNTQTDVRTSARKFVAPTSREALRLAREALGAEAMVLTNRVVAEGVEIVAMAPDDVEEVRASAPTAQAAPQAASLSAPAPAPVPASASAFMLAPTPDPVPAASPAATDSVLGELHSMRCMIEEQLAGVVWNDKQRRDPMRGRLLRTLLGAGFSAGLSKAMLEHLPTGQSYAQGMAFVRSELIRTLPVHEDEDALLAQGGVYALMGPTGVGKTTTTAKLAARCVMRFGADKLALVTTDSYRIGAYEQLRIYGQILNVPVYAVKDAADLHLVLQDLRDKHMVLIDTVGMSQRDRAVSDQIAMFCNSQRPVKRLLLLNAASHGDTLNEVVHAYRHGGGNELAGCIFTKVDEATHPGALIDTVIRHRLPVHYVSSGQKVPENLMRADRAQLVDSVFQANSRSALFVPGESDLQDGSANADASAAHAAQAEAERQRLQYRQLIRAMAHDAQEVAAAAAALASAPLGFDQSRALWHQAADEDVGHKAVLQSLMTHATSEIAAGCDTHLLALCGQVGLKSDEGGDAYQCHGSLLLSDRTGIPLAAPNQWLSTTATRNAADPARRPGVRQVQWLRQQDFGKTVVHMLSRLPAAELMLQWKVQRQQWMARAPGSTAVIDPRTGEYATLTGLDFSFGEERPVTFKGRAALQSEAQANITLRTDGGLPGLRCVVTRVTDPRSRKVVAQSYALCNVGNEVSVQQLAQWQAWAAEAEPCFRLLRQGLSVIGGLGEAGDPHMMKRLLIAGQVTTTVWRLLQADGDWAGRARALLGQLTGRPVRPGRPLSGNVLYAGMGKLFFLLEALDT